MIKLYLINIYNVIPTAIWNFVWVGIFFVLFRKKRRMPMPCFEKCFRFKKMKYNCRKLWSSAIQFQASLGLPMRQKSEFEIPLRLWLHLRFLAQELAIHLHSTRHDSLSVQFPLFCLPVYQSEVYLRTICTFSIRVHFPLLIWAEKNGCKVQKYSTFRRGKNQRAALDNTGCVRKSRIKKKFFHFKLTMDQINPKTSRNVCSLII